MPFLYKVAVACFLFLVLGNLPALSQCPPPNPIPTGDQSCTPKSFTLSATNSNDTYKWYDAINNFLFQGSSYSTPVLSATTTYYVTSYNSTGNCESPQVAVQAVILPNTGTPSVFGSDQWFAYCFNGISWNTYKGFYVDNNININTSALWDPLLSPNNGTSEVTGYIGCPVNVDNHSISYKRKGFPPGIYRIDITDQHDDFTLLINGYEVFSRVSYGQVYPSAWTGQLDESSQVEYKWLDHTGKSSATVNFVNIGPQTNLYAGIVLANQAYCQTANPTPFVDSTAIIADRNAYVQSGVYTPTPGQLLINAYAPDNIEYTYLSFDISSVPASSVNNAFLYINTYDLATYPNTTVFVYSTDTSWSESNISWTNKPNVSSSSIAYSVIYDINQLWYKFDVSSFIRSERNANHKRVSFLLNDTVSHNNPLAFYSRETAYPPILVLNNSTGGCTGYSYQWQSSLFCTNSWSDISGAISNTYTAPAGLTDSTCYRLVITDGCSNIAFSNSIHVNIDDQTMSGKLTVTAIDLNTGTIQINGELGQIKQWEISQDNFSTVSTILPTHATQISYTTSSTNDLYYRALIQSGACPSLLSDTVKILKGNEFLIFNSFSPNSDGINDVWKIEGIERYPDNKVSIVNSMGMPVYEASGYNNQDLVWNGSSGGQSLPDGTYYYSVQLPDKPSMTGYVIIKR